MRGTEQPSVDDWAVSKWIPRRRTPTRRAVSLTVSERLSVGFARSYLDSRLPLLRNFYDLEDSARCKGELG